MEGVAQRWWICHPVHPKVLLAGGSQGQQRNCLFPPTWVSTATPKLMTLKNAEVTHAVWCPARA